MIRDNELSRVKSFVLAMPASIPPLLLVSNHLKKLIILCTSAASQTQMTAQTRTSHVRLEKHLQPATANAHLKVSNNRFANEDLPPKLDCLPDGHLC